MSLVSCEKEKEGGKGENGGGNTEQPSDSIRFNTGTPIKIAIEDTKQKSGHYDAMTIYNCAYRLCTHWKTDVDGAFELMIWKQWRDTVEKKFALRGNLAISVPDGIHPEGPGEFIYDRNIVITVALNEDGSVWDISQYKDLKTIADEDFTDEDDRLFGEYGQLWGTFLNRQDTAAYIPNAVMDSMQPLMEKAFAEQDWAKCYELFENGYKFIPITGAEYMELVRQGKN